MIGKIQYIGVYHHHDSLTSIAIGPYNSGESFNVTYPYENKVYTFSRYFQFNTKKQLVDLLTLLASKDIVFIDQLS